MPRLAPFIATLLVAAALAAAPAMAGVLYAATSHDGQGGGSGRLYAVNALTAKARLLGSIRVDGGGSVAIDGLAIHPKTRVLYGITSRASPHPLLVTLDPRSAMATVVGPLGARGSDIHFDADGTLYIWIQDENTLGIVDLASGHVNAIASAPLKGATFGALAVNSRGVALIGSSTGRGLIEQLDAATGDILGALALSDVSLARSLDGLAFSANGMLLAVNEPRPGAPGRELVSIDTETGNVNRVGALPDEVDAIAFDERAKTGGSKRALVILFAAILVGLYVADAIRWRDTR